VSPAPATASGATPSGSAPANGSRANGGSSARPAASSGGGLTVPPLPPVPGPVGSGRRPLSNEDFEEELDIPEFLRSQ
jgi:cell division protein FtsZ